MKKAILLFTLLLSPPLFGFHIGLGYSWNTVDETFDSNLHTNENRSGQDRYETSQNRLAPVIEAGHQIPLCDDWLVGISAQWKYLNYKTSNVNSSRGQILQNASFSSINIFGPEVIRDFTSKTHLNNEVILLGLIGKELLQGYAYIGLGPVFFDASNKIYVSSIHVPNGVGDHLISTSVSKHKAMWGSAFKTGYQYCLNANSFINISYAYVQTGKYRFNNSINTAILNGFDHPGPTTLFLKRDLKFSNQEFMLSIAFLF